jgi:hypothetical protein
MSSLTKAHRLLVALLGAISLFFVARDAEATHFRYGNITYSIVDPINAPTTVRFEVTMAWRSTFIGSSTLVFGDGTQNPDTTGFQIGSGTDAAGLQYVVMQYFATHTYPSAGQYTASFTSCCRTSNLINAGDQSFLVQAKVDLAQPNIGNPIGQVPAIIQLQTAGVRTFNIGSTDPDGTPVTCRFATTAESSIPTNPPTQSNKVPVLATSVSPPGCTFTWDTTGGLAGNQYAVQVVMESTKQNGVVNSGVLDFIVEFVTSPPPKCTGSTQLVVDQGAAFLSTVTGTVNAAVGGNLVMTSIGTMAAVSPIPGTTGPSPFNTTLTTMTATTTASATSKRVSYAADPDGDGLINALDPDSDNDGLFDGTELGVVTPALGTDVVVGHYRPDADATTRTDPLLADTDGGGLRDGSRTPTTTAGSTPASATRWWPPTTPRADRRRRRRPGRRRGAGPRHQPERRRQRRRRRPRRRRANFGADGDHDGAINALDPDSDNDGLFDGTERGVTTARPRHRVAAAAVHRRRRPGQPDQHADRRHRPRRRGRRRRGHRQGRPGRRQRARSAGRRRRRHPAGRTATATA